jgi:20S proteasome subunit beta 1
MAKPELELKDFGYSAADGGKGLKEGEVDLGTSIMAVSFDGGVIVAADSRTTLGSYVSNRVSDKLTKLSDTIYCCRSGSAADTQAVADYAKIYLELHELELDDQPTVQACARVVQQLCYSNKDYLMAGIIIGGWDKKNGGQVYSIPLGGSLVKQPFAIGGSGSTYIYGFCDAYFREGMNKDECREFTLKALAHAMARDGSSGGIIRLAVIDKNGVEFQYHSHEDLPFKVEA